MGGHDTPGREYFLRNIIYSKLSYFELSVFSSVVASLRTWPRRVKATYLPFVVVCPPFYLAYDWVIKKDLEDRRKNPSDYENDV